MWRNEASSSMARSSRVRGVSFTRGGLSQRRRRIERRGPLSEERVAVGLDLPMEQEAHDHDEADVVEPPGDRGEVGDGVEREDDVEHRRDDEELGPERGASVPE